ncbi:tape measure protein [uncultured Acetobacteroides sp.]|uniref:tape measure protein n=1 Tax=uncultured Acetobacteroides sp. TaxID=1760811 RepID=UPI0029F56046|nr:tape measure protein [uncultured Acetobacteroides sp.]
MASLQFDAALDFEQLERDLKRGAMSVQDFVRTNEAAASKIDSLYKNAGTAIAGYFTFDFAKSIGEQIIEVTGEFQQLSVAFTTMLGSKERANQLMQQMVNTAASTPFSLTQVADGAKRLLAYGQSADTVNDTLVRLGNVASGASVPLDRVILAYGQVKAKGKLQGDDMRQFMEMGLPLVHELAMQFGVADSAIDKMVESGQVGFKDVEKVINKMTNAGGQFYNLMQEQSKTIPGQISNLGDTIDQTLNKIGTANAGLIEGVIGGVSFAVENYEVFITTLKGVAAAYGGYKAALMLVAAMENTKATMNRTNEAAALLNLVSAEKQAEISKLGLAKTSVEYANIVKAEVETNVLAAKSTLDKARIEVSAAAQTVEAKRAEYIATKELEAARLAEAMAIGATGTEKQLALAESRLAAAASTREAAALEFKNATQDFSAKKIAVETAAKEANTATTAVNTAAQAANAESTSVLTLAKTKLLGVMSKVHGFVLANPYAVAAAAVAAFAYIIYKLASQTSLLEESQKRLATSSANYQSAVMSETVAVDTLFGTLQGLTKGTKAYDDAKQAIISKYGNYLENLDVETKSLNNVAKAYETITSAVIKASMAKAQSEGAAGAQSAFEETVKPLIESLQENLNDKFGVKKGTELLTKMRLALQEGRGFNKELGDAINSFAKEHTYQSGTTGMVTTTYTNGVADIVKDIREARSILKSELKQNALLFGDPTDMLPKAKVASPTVSAQAKQTLEDIKKSEASLRSLRAANSKATADEIKKEEDNLSKLKATYATLTGEKIKTPKASVKDDKAYQEQLHKIYSDINKDKLSLMQDGTDKEMQAIKNEYADKLNEIEKQEKSLLEAYNKSKGLKKGDKGYLSQLPGDAQDAIERLKQLAATVRDSKELKLMMGDSNELVIDTSMDSLLESSKTFEQKRLDIVGQGMLDIATLENKGLKDQAAVRRKQMNDDVNELEASNREKLKNFAYLYDSIEKWGKAALQARIDRLNEDLKNTKLTDNEKLALEKALSETTQALSEKAPLAAMRELDKRIVAAKKKIASANGDANKIKEAQRDIDESTSKKSEILSNTFSNVSGHLSNIAQIVGQFNEGLGESIQLASGLAGAFSQLAQQNYTGAIISGAASIITSITQKSAREEAERRKEQELANDRMAKQLDIINKLYDMQKDLIDSAYGTDKIEAYTKAIESAKTSLDGVIGKYKTFALTTKKGMTNDGGEWNGDTMKLFESSENNKTHIFSTYQSYIKLMTDAGIAMSKLDDEATWNAKKKAADWSLQSIDYTKSLGDVQSQLDANRDRIKNIYKMVDDMLAKGINVTNKEVLDNLISDYEKYAEEINSLMDKQRTALTGSTYDSVVDSLASAFDDGVVSAEEFANTFGDLMKKQVLNSLKMQMLEKPLRDFYNQFALASESDGKLTADEVVQLRAMYEKIAADAKVKFDDMNSVMNGAGIDLFGTSSSSKENSAVGIVKNLSEQTGTDIVGNLTGMRYDIREQHMTIREQLSVMNESVSIQRAIEANTAATVRNLSMIGADISAIRGAIGSGSNLGERRAIGR